MEYEDVPCECDFLICTEVCLEELVSFFGGEVVWGSVFLGADCVFAEWVVLGVSHIYAPEPICPDCAHIGDDGVVASFLRRSFVVGVIPDELVFFGRD